MRKFNEDGLMVSSLLMFVAAVALIAVSFQPAQAQYERFMKRAALERTASEAVLVAQEAIKEGNRNPARAVRNMSNQQMSLNAAINNEQSYCIVVQWNDPSAGLEPVRRGSCKTQ